MVVDRAPSQIFTPTEFVNCWGRVCRTIKAAAPFREQNARVREVFRMLSVGFNPFA